MEQKKHLKWYNMVGYGSGDIAGNVVYALLSSFVMIYLTNTIGLNSGIVGTLIAVSKLLDGVTDIFFGSMIDKTKSKMGKARPWMLFGFFGCAVTLFACFAIPTNIGVFAQYAWFFIVNTHMVAGAIAFTGDLLGSTQNSIVLLVALAHGHDDVTAFGINTQNSAGQQLLSLGGVAFVNHATLSLADALDNHLLSGLGSDAAELLNINGDGYIVADADIGVDVLCSVDVDLQGGILHLFHNGLDLIHIQAVLAQVHHHIFGGDVAMIFTILAVSIGHSLLQTLYHVVHADALELFQLTQTLKNLYADVDLGGIVLLSSLCHCR